MNKRQIEALKAQLGSEKAVLEALEKQYRLALQDINDRIKLLQAGEETQSRIYQIQYQKTLRKQVQAIIDKLHADSYTTLEQFFNDTYQAGYVGTMYDVAGQIGAPIITPIDQDAMVRAVITDSKISAPLYDSLGIDASKLKKAIASEISRGIASGISYEDMARNIQNLSRAPLARAKTIARTEAHRIYETSSEDARQEAKAAGADVVKQWDATLDGDTRPTHRELDGQIRETDEDFESSSGRKAKFPGDFGDPAEDCNCRCVALTRARWALGEAELQTMKDRAQFFGLDKTDSFKDFEKKYLKAADGMTKASKIEANGMFVNKSEQLYRFAKKVKPIDGYEDFTCHADADNFYIDLGGAGHEDDFYKLTPEEYAERIKASNTYKGGNIRIISCQAGANDEGAAQRLADALGVEVYAPTEIVNITENGEMFLSDNDILAEMWYNTTDRSTFKETGKWRLFKPRKE